MREATAIAHPNIALVKYWGKRDSALNLPAAGSLSLTLGPIHTRTTVQFGIDGGTDEVWFDERPAPAKEVARLSRFLDLVRQLAGTGDRARVVTSNNFPTAAGLASSSSGFAALALAATHAAGLTLPPSELSVLARRGSGSAARSIFGGFAVMDPGERADGTDAFARPLEGVDWPLEVVIAVTVEGAKDVSSTVGMEQTERTSPYFDAWIREVPPAIVHATEAILNRDFQRLAAVAEASALQMHASAMAAVPGVIYWRGATIEVVHEVRRARAQGMPVFFTIDAGPHVKVFTTAAYADQAATWLAALPGVLRVIRTRAAGGAHLVVSPASTAELS
jgi:diphosphomevalonate decarboxylase